MRPHFGMGFPNVDADPKSIFLVHFWRDGLDAEFFIFCMKFGIGIVMT